MKPISKRLWKKYVKAEEKWLAKQSTKPLQLTEIFGWFDGTEATGRLINCKICGAVVQYDNAQMNLHQNWHNQNR